MILTLGAELDIATGDELKNATNSILKNTTSVKGIYLPLSNQQNGSGFLDLGRPPVGRLWEVQTITLFGSDDHTTVTGAASLYVGDVINAGLGQLIIPGLAIPSFSGIAGEHIWIYASQSLLVNFVSVSATQQVGANATVLEYHASDKLLSSGR